MDKINCKICLKLFDNESSLHKHLKVHKIFVHDYYHKFFPRYDKFDKKIIQFKDKEFYLFSDFNSKDNLIQWLKIVTKDEARDYCINYLKQRKISKNLKYALSQVELRSILMPGMKFLNELFGNYYVECKNLGFIVKFNSIYFNKPLKQFNKNHLIYIDSREQHPLTFSISTKISALKFGDYKLNDEASSYNLIIERKSVADLFNTMTSGIIRFKKELDKCKEADAYMVIVIENGLETSKNYSSVLKKIAHVNISSEFVFHNIRDIIQSYPNVQFLFVNDRKEASRIIEILFKCDGQFKDIDLQYAYDIGVL